MVTGSLQIKNDTYYAVLNYRDEVNNRKQKWISTKLPVRGNKRKAEEFLNKARTEFEAGQMKDPETILFSDYMENWLKMMRPTIEQATYGSYRILIEGRIKEYFGDLGVTVHDLQPKHIQAFYQKLADEGLSGNTAIHYHAVMRKALQYGVKTDLIPSNAADRVERPKKGVFIGSFYSREEMLNAFDVFKGTDMEIPVMFAAFYGLRRSEVLGLKWNAIDFENKTVTIKHTVTIANVNGKVELIRQDKAKNKSSLRSMPLMPNMEAVLLKAKAQQETDKKRCGRSYTNSDYICVNALGIPLKPDYLTNHFRLVLEKNSLRQIRFHDLRHSCASLLLASGVSMKEIQDWLGHAQLSTTAMYAHLDKGTKQNLANTLSMTLSY